MTRSIQDYDVGITKYSMNMLLDIAEKEKNFQLREDKNKTKTK